MTSLIAYSINAPLHCISMRHSTLITAVMYHRCRLNLNEPLKYFPQNLCQGIILARITITFTHHILVTSGPIYIQRLRRRCDIAPKSNLLFWCCTHKRLQQQLRLNYLLLENHFATHLGATLQTSVAVAGCKWALTSINMNYIYHYKYECTQHVLPWVKLEISVQN